jgi:hypothetical protein
MKFEIQKNSQPLNECWVQVVKPTMVFPCVHTMNREQLPCCSPDVLFLLSTRSSFLPFVTPDRIFLVSDAQEENKMSASTVQHHFRPTGKPQSKASTKGSIFEQSRRRIVGQVYRCQQVIEICLSNLSCDLLTTIDRKNQPSH